MHLSVSIDITGVYVILNLCFKIPGFGKEREKESFGSCDYKSEMCYTSSTLWLDWPWNFWVDRRTFGFNYSKFCRVIFNKNKS